MKARIKETGKIVDLAQEVIGHKGERFQWFQLELMPEPYDEFFDWQSFRAEAAKDILCAMIAKFGTSSIDMDGVVKWADSLISKLKEKEENNGKDKLHNR